MKTFLGITTGLLAGIVLGIVGHTIICSTDPHYMKFFTETCGYEYKESKEDET